MANETVTELTGVSTLLDTDLIYVIAGGNSRKMTWAAFRAEFLADGGSEIEAAISHNNLNDYSASEHFTQGNITTVGTVTAGNVDAVVTNASETARGKIEIATTGEINAGSDATRAIAPDQFQASLRNLRFVDFIVVEADTDVATGTSLVSWVCPFDGTIIQDDTDVDWFAAYTTTAGSTGTMIVDVNLNGSTIMTTNKLDIETGELDTTTAATQPDLTTTSISKGDIITVDIDAIHSGTAAKGLVVRLAIRPN